MSEAELLVGDFNLTLYSIDTHLTFENIVAKEEIAPAGAISSFATMFSKLSNKKNVHFFQQSEHSRFF